PEAFGESLQTRPKGSKPIPVFTSLPYLQPGPYGGRLVESQESIVVRWQTDTTPARYTLTYGERGTEHKAQVTTTPRGREGRRVTEMRLNHAVALANLDLAKRYRYRLSMDGEPFAEGWFTTRKPRGKKTRFVVFGDNSYGTMSDRAIAYHAYQARPDFVLNTGDTVYYEGRDSEYGRFFFPVYNATEAGPRIGSPLMRSVPFYSVLGNHDVESRSGGLRGVDFDRFVDGLGWMTNFDFPLNGPETPCPVPLFGDAKRIAEYQNAQGARHPRMANYSFDYGDGHFLCLDSNVYVDPTDPALQAWIEKDLASTDAAWKIVCFHHPPFNIGIEHGDEQHMRALCPLFERQGVDLVVGGHEHNYQRTRPLRFAPKDLTGAKAVGKGTRYVPGTFTTDRRFDGQTVTKPDGIVYLTSGAGGHDLYNLEMHDAPEKWKQACDDNVEFTACMKTDRHSLTVFDMDARRLKFRQIDEWGREIDHILITK
ncbi:metallophosphoesterase family protein, partial [bacterium]